MSCILAEQGGRITYNIYEKVGKSVERSSREGHDLLTLILADAELEIVPAELTGHPAVHASAKKRGRSPGSILLDSSLHHPALRNLPDGDRRGRPDLVHGFVLLCLDSILNVERRLETVVHTRHDDVIRFAPETRVPRNYTRFVGLMEDLFAKGVVPPDNPLIRLERGTPLARLLASRTGPRWAFAEGGEPIDLPAELARVPDELVAVVGGFPHGEFRSPVRASCDRVLSIHPSPLKAWTVAAEILSAYRVRFPAAGR
jgi:rRNA small subunit pseudouridine methyltransferase Nep1